MVCTSENRQAVLKKERRANIGGERHATYILSQISKLLLGSAEVGKLVDVVSKYGHPSKATGEDRSQVADKCHPNLPKTQPR